jgi:hypothetical protein
MPNDDAVLEVLGSIQQTQAEHTQRFAELGRAVAMLQQDVTQIRSLVNEVALLGPDIIANREHLSKLEREQGRFDLRLEGVERKVAGMPRT